MTEEVIEAAEAVERSFEACWRELVALPRAELAEQPLYRRIFEIGWTEGAFWSAQRPRQS
jgi:hypothetical protein